MRGARAPFVAAVATIAVATAALPASPGVAAALRAASASTGCPSAVATPGTVTLTPTVGGRARTVIVHVPSGYDGRDPVALVMNLHGSESTAAAQEAFSGMDATADADGFVVAYPQGAISAATGFEWNVPGQPLVGGRAVPAHSADDVRFLDSLVGVLQKRYCIDPHRVYATGFSGGARMASQLACSSPGTFAAVAPVSGLRFPGSCAKSAPDAVVAFHGTADPVDPYDGTGQAYWTYSVPTAASRWGRHDGCRASTTTHPASGVTLTTYERCRGDTAVELYTIEGSGHEWPGGPKEPAVLTRVLGPQTNAIDADSVLWQFFVSHARG